MAELVHREPDPGLGGSQWDVLVLGDVLRREAEDAGQHHGSSLLVGDVVERAAQPVDVARPHGRVGGIGLARRGCQPFELVGIQELGAGLCSHGIDGEVARDHDQPGRHAPSTGIECLRVSPRAQECLLRQVFGEARITRDRKRDAVHAALEPRDEGLGGTGIADREAGEEGLVGESPHIGDTKKSPVGITRETSVTAVIPGRCSPVLEHMNATSSTGALSPRRWVWLTARGLGALSLLAVGAVHLQQYDDLYSAIPTIGTLFVLNFVGASVLGVGLLVPFERLSKRWGALVVAALALGGIALAAVSYVFLLIAERRPLFGFMEPGYNPGAIQFSQVSEIATVALLGVYLVARHVPIGSPHGRPGITSASPREVRT
jgi:hypothetical protein